MVADYLQVIVGEWIIGIRSVTDWMGEVVFRLCGVVSWRRRAFLGCARVFFECVRSFLGCARGFLGCGGRSLTARGRFLDVGGDFSDVCGRFFEVNVDFLDAWGRFLTVEMKRAAAQGAAEVGLPRRVDGQWEAPLLISLAFHGLGDRISPFLVGLMRRPALLAAACLCWPKSQDVLSGCCETPQPG
jgi:hypothetical protein